LYNPVVLERQINGTYITFLVEATNPGFCHACTPQDVEGLLRLIPPKCLAPIKMIVMRQPKKKEAILSRVWGRLHYWSNIDNYSGPAIHLEAQPSSATHRWGKTMTPDRALELERLRRDGHRIISDRRYYYITPNPCAVRNTQLYRTLPHEIGHYVDYLESVNNPAGEDYAEWERLNNLFWSKPSKDKEDFAHRFASEFIEHESCRGNLPFDRLFDPELLAANGLDPIWFSSERR
jgi:hypothetical protein